MKKLFQEQHETLVSIVNDFPWEDKAVYCEYLAQTYYYVRHSTRLLAASACRFSHQDEALHSRYLKHAREENAHDVLAIRDLEILGSKISQHPELNITKMVYQPQYYQVTYIDPICLFGYIFALEGVASLAGESVYKRVLAAYGKEGTNFLKLHANEDIDHIEKAFKSIEGLPKEKMALIEDNFKFSVEGLKQFFTGLPKAVSSKVKKAA